MILALVLVVGSVVFFTLFEQAGSALNQFAERNTAAAVRRLLQHHVGPDAELQRRPSS